MFSRFHLIPERNGLGDRRTDGQICYINIARPGIRSHSEEVLKADIMAAEIQTVPLN